MPSTDVIILRELLAAEPGFVSGERLARMLGVSRVAVWMQLRKLARQGFAFEAQRSRGYRVAARPAQLHHACLLAHLHGRPRLPEIICLDKVDSTNSEAERRLAAGSPVPLVILAREQTHGRGRRGRPWHSASPGNLYVTFVFRPQIEPERLHDFTLWMGVNLCELVATFARIKPGLKWPNDLLIDGRKAGGMLTEARVDADQVRDLVFGIGLNINGRASDLPRDLQRTATSLADAAGGELDLNRFAAALIGRMSTAYAAFAEGSHRKSIADLWNRYDVLRGRPVTVIQGTRTVSGTASGIDADGSLLLRLPNGRTERFHAGEVTLAKDAAPAD